MPLSETSTAECDNNTEHTKVKGIIKKTNSNWKILWNRNECGVKTTVKKISGQPNPIQIMVDQKQM